MAAKNRIVQFYEKYSDKGKIFYSTALYGRRVKSYIDVPYFTNIQGKRNDKKKRWKWKACKDIDQTKTCMAVSKICSWKIE